MPESLPRIFRAGTKFSTGIPFPTCFCYTSAVLLSPNDNSVRLDKWLWAVRLYATRSQATAACHAGHVKVNGQNAKPARNVHPGELVTARVGDVTRTVKVLALLGQRVGAAIVPNYLEDLTPASEYEKRERHNPSTTFLRPKGAGRPTKKDRRDLNRIWDAGGS
jgi:ribosome-associated heat shock protein Hsp15